VQRYPAIFALERSNVEVAFRRFVAALKPNETLKAFFVQRALGPEALWHMRQRFAASLAATSAASYLLGIGDRHLDNYLLCLNSLEVVPIDFGYSFGIGALLPVPEMVPFRLTGFLLSVLQPLAGPRAHGTFRDGLQRALRKCREHMGVLMDACSLFIREPLLDWTIESRRRGNNDVEFLPRQRLRFLKERLRGKHPSILLVEELAESRIPWVKERLRAPEHDSIEAIAAGLHDDDRREVYERSLREGRMLDVAEQTDCLIRMATDPNILGRAWEGWAPEL